MHRSRSRAARRGTAGRALAIAAGLLLALLIPGTAAADAELTSTIPADGAVLDVPPTEVVLTFDQEITDRSSFAVLDSNGATVAEGALDPADPTTMRGALPVLAPGTYEVQWVAQSADGHLPRGTFAFTVAEPTAAPATPTPPPSDEPATLPTPTVPTPTEPATPPATASPAPGDSRSGSGDDSTDVLLPIAIVGLLIGGGLAVMLRRRPAA
jgi:hypothetical protein